jgi:flagellar assembly factor FliW
MQVQTTRFGQVEINEDRVITFASGLLGFSNYKRYALLKPDDDGVFYWLQSVDSPELAFVVTDPCLWIKEYEATIRHEQMEDMGLASLDEAQVFVIVNKYDQALTANLQGPLVINANSQVAMQLVLADKRWTTRHEIVTVSEPFQAATA